MTSAGDQSSFDVLTDAGPRAGVYRLLAKLWAREVDAAMLAALQRGPLGEAYRAVGGMLSDRHAAAALLDELQLDYCRLFVGPQGHFPPVQSVWEENRFEGAAAGSVRRFADLIRGDSLISDTLPADHVGNIFAIFGTLLTVVATGQEFRNDDLCELAVMLFTAHVHWIAKFAESAAPRAATKFYHSLMSVTVQFLTEESELIAPGSRLLTPADAAGPGTLQNDGQ